jgi:hypothetical protein
MPTARPELVLLLLPGLSRTAAAGEAAGDAGCSAAAGSAVTAEERIAEMPVATAHAMNVFQLFTASAHHTSTCSKTVTGVTANTRGT